MRWWLLAFVGAHAHRDVVNVFLQANEFFLKLVNAVRERGVSAVVVVQLIPQLPRDANELVKPVHESILSFVQ